jgi:hypothetical protein
VCIEPLRDLEEVSRLIIFVEDSMIMDCEKTEQGQRSQGLTAAKDGGSKLFQNVYTHLPAVSESR